MSDKTLGQFLTRWLEDVARPRVRATTWTSYEAAISRHVEPYIGGHNLAKLTPQQTQAWLSVLGKDGIPVGRQRYARVVLRAALNTAIRWRLVTRNAAALVDPPRTVAREIRPLTPDEARRLLMASADDPLHAFIAIALGCGLRLGEALGLKWEDVDLEAGTLQVRRALQRLGGDARARRPLLVERTRLLKTLRQQSLAEFRADRTALQKALFEIRAKLKKLGTTAQLVEPKSPRSRRTIGLPAVTVSALRSHRVRQKEARLAAGKNWREHGFVFTTPIGTPGDPFNIHKQFKALLERARLPPMRFTISGTRARRCC